MYLRRTLVNTVLLASAICGLWAGAVYAPTAIIALAKKAGMVQAEAVRTASFGMGLLSLGTILGCLAVPPLAERIGRKRTLAIYFVGMAACILLSFGWAFYLAEGLKPFILVLFFLGFFGGNFAVFSLWLPEQYGTSVRATAFAFTTSFGRFIAAGVNFGIGALVGQMGTLGKPVAITAIALRNRSAGDSVRSGDARESSARLKGPRDEERVHVFDDPAHGNQANARYGGCADHCTAHSRVRPCWATATQSAHRS